MAESWEEKRTRKLAEDDARRAEKQRLADERAETARLAAEERKRRKAGP